VRRSIRPLLLAAAAILLFGLPSLNRLYIDYLWFGEVGYGSVFSTVLRTRVLVASVAFVVTAAWLAANLLVAMRTLRFGHPVLWVGQGTPVSLPGRTEMRRLAVIGSCLVAVPVALFASSRWMTWLAFRYRLSFGTPDPVLGHDPAFYIFTLPFLDLVRTGLLLLVVLGGIGAAAVYAMAGGLGMAPTGGLIISRPARQHLAVLASCFFVLLAAGAWLDIPRQLVSSSGLVFGASYADVAARIPIARLLTGVALLGAVLSLFSASRRLTWLVLAAGMYLAVSLGGEAVASALQRFVVAPNEQARETPYMGYNIAATRKAFGLDRVEERELSGDATLSREHIASNAATLRNVRLWDHQPLLDTFGQLQEMRPYYDFVSVDNDRYMIDGELRQVMLSGRELNSQALPNRTWINERLTFTHGYGLTLGPVNQVTQEGLPVLYVKDLPPVSTTEIRVTQPSLYFSELSNDYVFVKTSAAEFDYPRGDDNVTTHYGGTGGVPVASALRKALLALRFGSQQIFFSRDINNESRILFHRRIADRVRTIAPFLSYDEDPYLVVMDGRLYWIQDAYTYSTGYPYSTPADSGINYIRNAVKVTIDAYNGTTTFYLADPGDPIAATYQRMFPQLFRPLDEMPAGLRQHVRYPETLFGIQSAMYTTFHMTNPVVFYNKEDQWEVPQIDNREGQTEPMEPYYTIMKLPGQSDAEFIQMLPLTPRRKDNLAAWMVARSDGEHYGHLLVFRFPKQKVVFGPRQVIARINQDQVIAPQITLWNQQGSQVLQGTLLVVPIEESLLYIRPLYLRGAGGRIPELKRVIVAYQNSIVMEETLEEALDRLFGEGATAGLRARGASSPAAEKNLPPAGAPPETAGVPDALATQAWQHYDRAIAAQRAGDWATYGEEIKQLGAILQKMQDATRNSPSPRP
jgi:uncharacterized membrane protein (UPF0182 family)